MANIKFSGVSIFKKLRVSNKLTQVAMAEILKVSQPAYSMLESGLSWPSFEVIENTMEAFNVSFKRFREYYHERKSCFEGTATK